jgi:hypothetical protein
MYAHLLSTYFYKEADILCIIYQNILGNIFKNIYIILIYI